MKPRGASKFYVSDIGFFLFIVIAAMTLFCSTTLHAGTVLFQDNFDSGKAIVWRLDPGWLVVNDGGNYVLSGSGHSFASTGDASWTNYSFKAKIKLQDSGSAVHLNYRASCDRYFIGFSSDGLALSKTRPCGTHTPLVKVYDLHSLGQWYSVEIVGNNASIKVYVDGVLKIDHVDSEPVTSGSISFETLTASTVYIDEVVVTTNDAFSNKRWESTEGPPGGLGYDVRIHPQHKNIMYVTDNYAGVAKSENAGQPWYRSNRGISVTGGPTGDFTFIFSLTIDPNNPDIIWAGTNGDGPRYGVFKSTDAAATWELKTNGISLDGEIGLVFRGFTIQPGNSQVVYAQAEVPTTIQGYSFNRVKGRVYKTTDGGESWRMIWEGDNLARYLIVHPSNPDILYLSTGIFDREAYNSDCGNLVRGGLGVLKSSNGGQNWFPINSGITDLYVGCLRMHPGNPEILFAATGNNVCSWDPNLPGYIGGLFQTLNGGTSWKRVIHYDELTTVNFSPSNPNVVYAGGNNAFYRSGDGGVTWNRFTKPTGVWYGPQGIIAGFPIDVVVDPDNSDIVYVNNYTGGVIRSVDGAKSWQDWSKGYTGAQTANLFIPDDQPSAVYAIGTSGPFVSSSFGTNWTGIANGEAEIYPTGWAIACQPFNSRLILIANAMILRSTDGGNDFKRVFSHPNMSAADGPHVYKTIAFSRSNPKIVYAGLARASAFPPSPSSVGPVICKSQNAGETFTTMASILDGSNVNKLIVSPNDSNIVYAATSNGVYKSSDGAANWVKLSSLGNRHVEALAVDFREPNFLIAGEPFGGIWTSRDTGSSWTGPHNTGFNSANPFITALVFDPSRKNTVFAGDLYSGIYRSTNNGLDWSPFPDSISSGLSVRVVRDIAMTNQVIYVATGGGGVFRYFRPETKRSIIGPLLPVILED
jgi:photosystem II stability/assembly factor-like uncharacterized protein